MFGQYLLHQGLVGENDLEKALDFQNKSRPTFETLVRAQGLLSDTQILDLLTIARQQSRTFEDIATERGLLRPEEVKSLQERAGEYHLPLGETLVLLGILDRMQMEEMLLDYWNQDGRRRDEVALPVRRQQPLERLKTLCKLFQDVGASKRLSDTLKHLLTACRTSVPCDCGFIATVDPEKNIKIQEIWETRARLAGLKDVAAKVIDLEKNHTSGIFRHVAATGKAYRTGNVESEDEIYYVPGWQGVRSNLTVPILNPEKKIIGVLLMESVDMDAFTPEDQVFLEILAGYAAMAMDRAGHAERREKEGRILWDFSHCMLEAEKGVVTTEGTLKVLHRVLDLCLEEVEANQGFIALLDPDKKALEISIVKGDRLLPTTSRPEVIPLGEGITGRVAATARPLLVNDVNRNSGFIPIFEEMHSELAVPLIYLNQVIGVLNIESRQKDAFREEHLDYCTRLADAFAPLVRSAQFYEYTKDKFGVGIQLVGRSLAMTRLKEVLVKAARSEASIMLIGDSGTGKEYIAKHIHFNSRRRAGPFEVISCTNTHSELVESELFGHIAGSFTGAVTDKVGLFEIADGGTVLLDEIGDLQLDLQGKLLRVLQEGTYRRIGDTVTRKVNVRVVTATNKDLKAMVAEGTFRQDLFYRLDQVALHIPPLRERREDILLLTDYFVKKYSKIESRDVKGLSEGALALLWRQDWPGNVRELEYFIYKLLIFSDNAAITGKDVERIAGMFDVELKQKIPTKLEDEALKHEIQMALNATRTEKRLFKARATRYLGWDKNTLSQKIRSLGISA